MQCSSMVQHTMHVGCSVPLEDPTSSGEAPIWDGKSGHGFWGRNRSLGNK